MKPPFPHFGETLALLNALIWAVAVILFRVSGLNVPPVALNLFKNVIGLFFLGITIAFFGGFVPANASIGHALALLLSGAVGIGLADSMFFESLNILGASRSAIIDCLYSPFIIFFAFLFLGEMLETHQFLGAAMIVGGVFLTSLDGSQRGHLPSTRFWRGTILGGASMALMAFSIVIVKPILSDYPVLWSTMMRMAGGVLALAIFSMFGRGSLSVWSIFRPQRSWRVAIPGAFLGAYVAIILWMAGFKYSPANIAGLLTQTSALFTVLLAVWILKEPMNRWKVFAVILATGGSILVLI